ncbi:MAG: DUF2202 domain-containing protein [Haloferacaceae archaeon]
MTRPTTRRTVLAGVGIGLSGVSLVGTALARQGRGAHGSPGADETATNDAAESDDGASTLTEAERDGLRYMREEEKLARDVYLTLHDEWGLSVFANVAESEQRHVDAMLGLLDRYDVSDPSPEASGTFANDDLQALYDALVARGRTSAVEALRVGGLIEETDMVDIAARIEETDEATIERVYGNLLDGSENHLRAFVAVLERRGVDYEAQVLSRDDVAAIVDDA